VSRAGLRRKIDREKLAAFAARQSFRALNARVSAIRHRSVSPFAFARMRRDLTVHAYFDRSSMTNWRPGSACGCVARNHHRRPISCRNAVVLRDNLHRRGPAALRVGAGSSLPCVPFHGPLRSVCDFLEVPRVELTVGSNARGPHDPRIRRAGAARLQLNRCRWQGASRASPSQFDFANNRRLHHPTRFFVEPTYGYPCCDNSSRSRTMPFRFRLESTCH